MTLLKYGGLKHCITEAMQDSAWSLDFRARYLHLHATLPPGRQTNDTSLSALIVKW